MNGITVACLVVIAACAGLLVWRRADRRCEARLWSTLEATASDKAEFFDPACVANLPEPARRYLLYSIRPGARLCRAVRLDMAGELGLGNQADPKYRTMSAVELLAPPHGLVWQFSSGIVTGSDGASPAQSWTRIWLFGMIPIVRASGQDHHRSAFGRLVAEGAFFAPASLLPQPHVHWSAVDASTARAIVTYGQFTQAVDIRVADTGQPLAVSMQRWSNENPDKIFREQPFGGYLSRFREFSGYRLPTHVEAGNHFGTDHYFPFFKASITSVQFVTGDNSA